MATIDLGKIKQVWRGTYNNSTAYAVDDLVEYTDGAITSSYICTTASTGNAPSSGGTAHGSCAYVAKGQAPSPTTTAGDIIYRGASADARLAKGTAGQVLKMNSGATAPEWGTDVGGKIVAWKYNVSTTGYSRANDSNWLDMGNFDITYTPTSTSNKIILGITIACQHKFTSQGSSIAAVCPYISNDGSGGSWSHWSDGFLASYQSNLNNVDQGISLSGWAVYTPSNTNSHVFRWRGSTNAHGNTQAWWGSGETAGPLNDGKTWTYVIEMQPTA